MSESYAGKINRKLLKKRRIINAAAGREPSDLVLKNATYVNVFSNELSRWMWASRKPGRTILPVQSSSTVPEYWPMPTISPSATAMSA